MTARERILAIRLTEKQERNSQYAKQIGVQVNWVQKPQKAVSKTKN